MRRILTLVVFSVVSVIATGAQTKAPVTRSDYGQWESISPAGVRGGFSPDGRWLAYGINRSSRDNELRLLKIADGTTKTTAFGSQATFSSDSKWAAYSVGYSETEQEKLRTERRPVQNKLGLLNLDTGDAVTVDGVQSFAFSGDGTFLAMRRYPPTPPGQGSGAAGSGAPTPPPAPGPGGGAAAAANQVDDEPTGATLLVRDLSAGRDTSFGNIGEYAWQNDERSHLLALTMAAEGKIGNGVHLFDPKTGIQRVLDSSAANYVDLGWREKSADLAVLRAKTDEHRQGSTYIALSWRQVGSANEKRAELDPTSATGFPSGMRTVSFRRPSWSNDGTVVFLGVAKWDEKPPTPARGRGAGAAKPEGENAVNAPQTPPPAATPPADEPAAVDIWHWNDVDVMAKQKLSATNDRRRNLLSAWHLDSGRFVQLAKSWTEQVAPTRRANTAYVEEWAAYAMDRSIGRRAADLYLADLSSGTRTKLKDRVDDAYAQVSPTGRYVLYLEDDQYWTIDLSTKAVRNITKTVATSFVDRDSDATVRQKPAFGVAGWTKDDAAVVLYDKLDMWQVAADGSRASRLTDGAPEQVRHRYVRIDPDEESIDLDKPLYVSLFGIWSKKSGYGRLMPDNGVERLVWLDRSVTSLARAKDAPVFAYTSQDYDDSPDIFVAGPDLKNARQVTTTNAFQSKFAWGRSELVEYKTDKGRRLQGALYYPAGYEAGKSYPMIVYLYERLSDGVHRYVPPSDRDYYNTSVFTTQGYFVLQPDIVFRPRDPGVSVVECVTAGVKKVVSMGAVDAKRVGVVGHSWGGFDTAFLATHTTDVFHAAVAGAPITDLVSNYGNHHWSSGIAETDHIETGQQRMEVPIWEDFPAYVRNSAVFNVQNMTTPLLLEAGDNDGTVFWHQSVELYNIARRAKKNVVMLVYNGEDHGLRQKKNQVDYQRRILEWFGYYLKGDQAAAWITNGLPYLERR